MEFKAIQPVSRPIDAVVEVPGSKSLTNRALILAALAQGRSTLSGVLFSEDTELMMAAMRTLGIQVDADAQACTVGIEGCSGQLPATDADLFCGNSGTTIRFCTALCALGRGAYRLDGIERMRSRPIGPLVEALRGLGVSIGYESVDGFPPVIVRGGGLRGGGVAFASAPSSQFISALLMVAPYARGDIFLDLREMVSVPYVTMTLQLMEGFGVAAVAKHEGRNAKVIIPAPQTYAGQAWQIEPDASNASYFLAAAAVTGGSVTVRHLGSASTQGDVGFVDVLRRMGCHVERSPDTLTVRGPSGGERLAAVDVDLGDMPDVAQTLAVAALFADGTTHIRNVGNLRIKETDRLTALATELMRFGAEVEVGTDSLSVTPPNRPLPARVHTYNDHRMAMSFAVAGLMIDGVEILDPGCVAKTFPDFFERFDRLRG
ncbi:MAG TPA: 3-phosphoshikimate 1-carboxyvinyltransferase [Phycisphaerae bacterium]|nr:3-phosphoshikimate 1-carboxyvinyltransferase [Phycisphaerales bacterium]HRX84788.1 3-phosphoshikimate 1-carboxyvinyltransferase [Phycisphaerae bacterium]